MRFLKQNVNVHISVGPFLDKADGFTAKVSMTPGNITGIINHDHDDGSDTAHQEFTCSAVGDADYELLESHLGMYDFDLPQAQVNIVGRMTIMFYDVDVCLPVWHEFMVLPANVYDSLLGTDLLDTNVTQWEGHAVHAHSEEGTPTVEVVRWAGQDLHATTVNGVPVVQMHDSAGAGGINAPANFEDLNITDTTGLVRPDMANASGNYGGTVATVTTLTNHPATVTAGAISAGAINNAAFNADVGNTAVATNIISQAVELVIKANNLDHLIKTAKDTNWATTVTKESIIDLMTSKDTNQTFARGTDSLEAIRDAIVASNPVAHSATANTEVDNTTLDAGTYADTSTNDGTARYEVGPGAAVGGFGLNAVLTFGIGTGRVPSTVLVDGHFHSGASRTVQVWAYNYYTAAYVQLSNSANDFGNSTADSQYVYSMTTQMVKTDGEVKIRFTSTSETADDVFSCDFCEVNSVAVEAAGLTADAIQKAVWYRSDSGHDEGTLGYNLGHYFLVKGHPASATSGSQFVLDTGSTVNDTYNGMLIMAEDKTDDHYEVRRVVDYIGGTKEVFTDTAFTFTPATEDDYYILSAGYANVNVTHVAATAQTANDNGADINDILTDTGTTLDTLLKTITSDAIAEMAQGIPPATPTLIQAVMYLYMALRNARTTTATLTTISNNAGTVIAKATLSDDATTFVKAEYVSGS